MNPQAFDTLEFDSLRALVRRGAQTTMGRERIDVLMPFADLLELQPALSAVGENAVLRQRGDRLSFDGVADTSASILRLKIEGAALDPLALLDLARLCERAIEARAAVVAEREQAPTLFEIVASVPAELKKLASLLPKKILPGAELDARASPELARLRRELPAIERAAEAIAGLDFINAKTAFAERFDCVVPEVAQTSVCGADESQTEVCATLEFIEARHPLLEENLRATGAAVVPVSFKLDAGNTAMVISGANAGGKTVVLKTAGLLSLMALSGLPVPAKQARVPFYRSVLADIGDHQSLAANLSTFTSHVANIGSMIESCETPALVLLDEVGTGTDPEEGSALGVAVVDHFKQRGAHVLATTHYSGLKMYAANEPGVLNASVEFDEKTLRPTYRLLVGVAGSSSGLEIAQRFGVPSEIISNASRHVKGSSRDAIEYLRRLKREAEDTEVLRRALQVRRPPGAPRVAALDQEAEKHERERHTHAERQLANSVAELGQMSRELFAKIEDRATRLKVERQSERRTAELKRAAQRAAKTALKRVSAAQASSSRGQEGG